MRVRITTRMEGTIDGIDLTRYEAGHIYDLTSSLADYLVASGYAIPVDDPPVHREASTDENRP